MPSLKARLLSVAPSEVTFARRGFEPCEPPVRERIELYFTCFLDGYHLALAGGSLEDIARYLDRQVEPELRGFAYEGAGMYLSLLDCLTPWRADRLRRFVDGPARHYSMITLIGAGLALARVPWGHPAGRIPGQQFDPELRWLAMDGYGFHEGFFHHQQTIVGCRRPALLRGYAARCFDHGLGRSIWFVQGAVPARIARAISAFSVDRQPDLWSGVGLACAYAGGVHSDLGVYAHVLDALAHLAGPHRTDLRLGVVLAAFARLESGVGSAWMAVACERLLGRSSEGAGRLGRDALEWARAHSDPRGGARGYEHARRWIADVVSTAPSSAAAVTSV